jgi:hypothetical protein
MSSFKKTINGDDFTKLVHIMAEIVGQQSWPVSYEKKVVAEGGARSLS